MNSVTQAATNFDQFRLRSMFYRSAREGFQDFLGSVLESDNRRVLLPAFIGWSAKEGSGVYDPVLSVGAEASFYSVRDDLLIDLSLLEQALDRVRPKVIMVIHYFGRAEPQINQVRQMAKNYGAILVEDLAHGFFSRLQNPLIGQAPVCLFSLHKMFPLNIGGLVQYHDPNLISSQRETAPEIGRFILDYDWQGIAERRRKNFAVLLEALKAIPELDRDFRLIWPELDPFDVPQTLPVSIENGRRDEIYTAMNAEGFGMTSLYHTIIGVVHQNHPEMVERSKKITNFPVHQDVQETLIGAMVESFRKSLKS